MDEDIHNVSENWQKPGDRHGGAEKKVQSGVNRCLQIKMHSTYLYTAKHMGNVYKEETVVSSHIL